MCGSRTHTTIAVVAPVSHIALHYGSAFISVVWSLYNPSWACDIYAYPSINFGGLISSTRGGGLKLLESNSTTFLKVVQISGFLFISRI